MAEVFISYSRTDAAFVRKLDGALAKASRNAWVDWQDIPLTAEWLKEVFAGIEGSDNFVFVISQESVASETCQKEVAHASANNKRIIPILHRAVPDAAVPEALRRLNWIYFRESDDFDATFASLIEALDTDLEWKRDHSRLLVRAKEWERERQETSFLLRGKDLREAEQWQAQTAGKGPKPTALHSQYILASRQAETRRQRQQLGAVIVALILTIGLAIAALLQRNAARRQAAIATSRQLAVQSSSLVDKKPDLALLLAVEAEKADDNFETRSALFTTLERQPKLKAFLHGVGNPPSGFFARRLNALAFTKDGSMIAAVGGLKSNVIILWDTATLHPIATLEGHTAPVDNVAFTPDGKTLLSGGDDKILIFWDVQGRQPLAKLTDHTGAITSIAVNGDGTIAASGDDKNNVILWDVNSRSKIGVITSPNTRTITHLLWRDPNLVTVGRRAAKPENDEITEFWDTSTLQRLGDPLERRLLAFSQDLGRVASVGKNEGTSPFAGITIYIPKLSELSDAASNPPQETTESQEILVNVNDTASGKSFGAYPIQDNGPMTSAAFSPDGSMLAFGDDSAIRMWDINARRTMDPLQAHQGIVDTVAFAPDGKTVASTGWDDAVILWDVSGQGVLGREFTDGGGGLLAFSPDGKTLAATTEDSATDKGNVVLWDTQTGKPINRYEPKRPDSGVELDTPGSLAFNPQGTMLAIQGNRGASLLSLNNSPPEVPPEILNQATAIAFHPSGKTVIIAQKNGEILLWEFSSHQAKWRIPASSDTDTVNAVAFDPSGKELAAGYSNGTIAFWDGSSGQAKSQHLQGFDDAKEVPGTLAFSSDGKTLVATGHETMSLWDVASHTRVNSLSAHSIIGAPLIAALSPDAKILAWSTLYLSDVNVVDSRARQQFGPPLRYSTRQSDVHAAGLAFSPDGKTLASTYEGASGKGKSQTRIVLWNFDVATWKRRACAIANRNLTREEWAQYLGPAPYSKTCPELP